MMPVNSSYYPLQVNNNNLIKKEMHFFQGLGFRILINEELKLLLNGFGAYFGLGFRV
jgi:hypothetical protein